MNMAIGGLRVIESVSAMKVGQPKPVARTWRERWLSVPWRPWVRTMMVRQMEPCAYATKHELFIHPSLMPVLRQAIEADSGVAQSFYINGLTP